MAAARAIQTERFAALGLAHVTTNAACPANVLDMIARPDNAGMSLLRAASEAMRLTARAYHRVLKVARTIADLAGSEALAASHIAEAIGYRRGIDRI